MDDIFKSIKAYLYDRAASPLIGAYLMAWAIWNYRVFVIIFTGDKETLTSKFHEIDALFKSFDLQIWNFIIPINGAILNGILIPILITISYLYVYPFLAKPVYEHSLRKQKELRDIKQEEEKNRLLSVEESREIYKRLSDMQAEHEREVESYTKQISSLNQTINDLESQLSSEVKQADSLRETKFDDINDADAGEFDNAIRTKIDSFGEREFQLSDLFTTEQWTSLNSSLKQSIGKRLKSKVDRGDFVGVSANRKGSGNQQVYAKESVVPEKKKSSELNSELERTLQLFSGLEPGHCQTAQDVKEEVGIHIEAARMHLHDLSGGGYIGSSGTAVNQEQLYSLEPKGRKYLIEHDLLLNDTDDLTSQSTRTE